MRGHHQGSVFQRKSGRGKGQWVALISLPDGQRRSKYAATQERAEELLEAMRQESPPHHLRVTGSRLSFVALIEHHLAWAAKEKWGREKTARVLATSLSYARIKFGIWGPCVYCGTAFADTVDHVLPRVRGGTDDPENLVSACSSCNMAKGSKLVGAFLASRHGAAGSAASDEDVVA